jgi:hypothetical protein
MSLQLQYIDLFRSVSHFLGFGADAYRNVFRGKPFRVSAYTQGTSPDGPRLTWIGSATDGYGLFHPDMSPQDIIDGVYLSVFLPNGATNAYTGTFKLKKTISGNVFEIDREPWGAAPTAGEYWVRNLTQYTKEEQLIHDCIQDGLRQFYYPAVVDPRDGKMKPHRWSFLRQ